MRATQRYTAEYSARFSKEIGPGPRTIGIEIEWPVIDKKDHSDFNVPKVLFPSLLKEGFEAIYDDQNTKIIVGVKDEEGREVTPDAGQGVMEVALPKRNSLRELEETDSEFLLDLTKKVDSLDGKVLWYGIHPKVSSSKWVEKSRYNILRNQLPPQVDLITAASSSQVQLQVSKDECQRAVNVFNALSGFFITLFANSPVSGGKKNGALALRQTFYEQFAPERCGMLPYPFESMEEYIHFTGRLPFIYTQEKGKCVAPTQSFNEYIDREDKRLRLRFLEQWNWHEGMIWWDTRPRIKFGTIEIRMCCCQPRADWLTVAALSLGIMENLSEIEKFLEQWSWQELRRLRGYAIKYGMEAKLRDKDIVPTISNLLKLAHEGLEKRELDEEKFLDPLFVRVEKRESPAQKALKIFEKKGLRGLIDHVSK